MLKSNHFRILQYFGYSVLLFVACILLKFNGLYGQDAHEYLRQSRDFFVKLQGGHYVPMGRGAAEFAVGYPLTGALLQLLGVDAVRSLQLVSLIAAGVALMLFDKTCAMLSPGTKAWVRRLYAVILLGGAPVFMRSAVVSMSDMTGLALVLAALFFGLRYVEDGKGRDLVLAAFFCGLAVLVRFAVGALLLPMVVYLSWKTVQKRQFVWGLAAAMAGGLAVFPHFWLKAGIESSTLSHSLLGDWSLLHFFHRSFTNANGTVQYTLPNGLYVLFPLGHVHFFILLALLFFAARKTDLLLPSKRLLLVCLATYLLFLGGVPHQNIRYLLPAYTALLLLFFPAWDRFISYGFYFLKNWWMQVALVFFVVWQVFFSVKNLLPTLARNHLEQQIAAEIGPIMPADAVFYGFDLDIALRSYLPNLQYRNLYEKRYETFPAGAFVLFNEPLLRPQWQGKNPMLNWEHLTKNYSLEEKIALPEGWMLYRIKN